MTGADNEPLLEAANISKSFFDPVRTDILKSITIKIMPGESTAIIGRSGEGKSTLLQILGTLETPCGGELKIAGKCLSKINPARIRNEHIGFVFQSFHLLEDYTTLENVLMPARIAGKSVKKGSASWKRGLELLEMVGLKERAFFQSKFLSGGEKQRVALARAMCNDPCLILADEPSGNLDRQTAELIHTILLDFARKPGKGLLLVTHDKELAALCTKQYELMNGVLR